MASAMQDLNLQQYLERMKAQASTRPLSAKAAQIMQERNLLPMRNVPWVIQLQVVGSSATLNLRVGDGPQVIGRASHTDDAIPDIDLTPYQAFARGVSRRHAAIASSANYLTIQDLDSANGTYINGMQIPPGQRFPIQNGDELMLGDFYLQVQVNVLPSTGELRHPKGTGQHILIIENDMDVAYAYRIMLENCGFQVSVTDDPTELPLFLSQVTPDAVICDLILEQHIEADIVALLRQYLPQHIPMIVVSGLKEAHQRQHALDAGANLFIGKPVHIDELVGQVSALLAARSA